MGRKKGKDNGQSETVALTCSPGFKKMLEEDAKLFNLGSVSDYLKYVVMDWKDMGSLIKSKFKAEV